MANIYDTLIEQERQTTGITPTQASSNSSNIYDDIIIKERSDAQQYRSAVMEAVKTSPDRAAQVQKISKELLLPTAVVDRNMDDLDRLARARRLELLRAANDDPVLARQLSDSEFAKIAQDDTDNLSFTGKVFKFFRDTVTDAEKGFKSGRITNEMGFLGERAMVGQADKAMWKRIADLREKQKQLKGTGGFVENAAQLIGQQFDTVPEVMHFGAQAALAGGTAAAIAGQLGPQIATPEEIFTVPTAAIGAFFAGSAAKMGEQTYRIEAGSAYVDMLESGIDKDVAVYSSAGVGLVNAALELTGMHFIAAPFKKLLVKETTKQISKSLTKPTMQAALKQFGKDYAGAVLGETSTEFLQEISNVIGEEIGRSMSDMQNLVETEEGRKQIADRLTGIFEQVTKGMALLAIPGAGLHFRTEVKRVKDAEKNGTFFDSLSKGIDTSKVLERNPDAYHSFIANQATDAQVENLYIDGKMFAQTMNQHGIKADQLEQVMPGLAEKIQDAALTGGDVVIPTADFATHLAKTDAGKSLFQHVRTDASALSVAEASQAGNLAQQLLKGADGILAKNEERKEWVRSANEVQKTMFDQIKGTGAYSDPVSRLYAATVKAFYVNLADRNGTTPMEEYQKNPYKVEMGELNKDQSGITYSQEGNINIDGNFKNWFGESKVVDENGQPLIVYHGSKNKFTEFEHGHGDFYEINNQYGPGFYLTNHKQSATGYGKNVIEGYASIQNPITKKTNFLTDDAIRQILDRADYAFGQEWNAWNQHQDKTAPKSEIVDEFIRRQSNNNDLEKIKAMVKWFKAPEPMKQAIADVTGTDGVIAKDVLKGIDVFTVFSPTQIKSINNRGTFDPNNPNILKQSFAGMSQRAGELAAALNETGTVKAEEGSISPTGILYSTRTWTQAEKAQIKDLAKEMGIDESKVDKWMYDIDNAMARVLADPSLDFIAEAADLYSALKPNSDPHYTVSLDFSTLCRKRYELMATIEAIQNMTGRALTKESWVEVREMLDKMGYNVSCGACYVDSKRMEAGKFINKFIDSHPDEDPKQFLSQAGIDQLKRDNPSLYAEFKKAIGSNNAKTPESRTDYHGEIRWYFLEGREQDMKATQETGKATWSSKRNSARGKKRVEAMNKKSGLRWQSWSDFEVPHLMDAMQAVLDMHMAGLMGHAYTKVPDFVLAMGKTGLMVNMSLIPKGTGLDTNGALVFDTKEGMPFDVALELREKHEMTAGTIAIGVGNEHIKALLADPRIDYVIPYHASGLSKEIAKKFNMDGWEDYTHTQSEDIADFQLFHKMVGKKDKKLVELYKAEMAKKPNQRDFTDYRKAAKTAGLVAIDTTEYWDNTKSGKDNAGAYLELAASRGVAPKFRGREYETGRILADFTQEEGYWKLLIDRKMYDHSGNNIVQEPVKPEYDQAVIDDIYDRASESPAPNAAVPDAVNAMADKLGYKGEPFKVLAQSSVPTTKGDWYYIRDAEGDWERVGPFKSKAEAMAANAGRGGSGKTRKGSYEGEYYIETDSGRDYVVRGDNLKSGGWAGENEVYQSTTKNRRAGYDPSRMTTILTQESDYSSFLHETSHFFLDVYSRIAADPNAPARIKEDMQTMLDWFGVESLEAWNAMTLEEQRKHHEAFAYNFEIWVAEGKSPSVKMENVFRTFGRWLKQVYEDIRGELNDVYRQEHGTDLPILTGEVRQVMERMLASEQQIKESEQVRAMAPIFDVKPESMTDEEWAAYQELQREAHDKALDEHTMASLRSLKWLEGARSRVFKELQRKARDAREKVKSEATEAVKQMPIYRAIRFIKHGEFDLPEDANQKTKRAATEMNLGSTKLSIEALKQMYGEEANAAWRHLPTGPNGLIATEGVHPDVVAEMFGFSSGDAMVREILAAKPMKDAINEETDRRMLEEHDELSNPDAMQEAVDRAIHNEIRAKFIGVELRHLAKSQQPVRVMQEAARRAALQILEKMQLKNIRPQDFMAAEAKASRAADTALRKGDIATATAFKEQQLLQNQLAAEALKAKEQIKKDLKYLEGLDKDSARKKMGPEAAEQIDMLLEKVDLKPPSMKQAGEIAKFKTWVKAQLNQGVIPDMAVSLLSPEERRAFSAEVEMRDEEGNLVYKEDEDVALLLADAIDRSSQRPYYEMSIDEWQGLVDTIRNIHHIGKAKTMMIAMADGLSYEQVRDEIASSIAINAKKGGKNTRTANDWLGKKIEGLRQFGAAHIKVATWARIMDGGKDNGPVWRFFVQTANERASWETSQRAEATEKLAAILAPVLKKVSTSDKVGKGKFFPSIGESLNWEARMAIAMNYGNDSNLQRLLDGMGWSIEQIMPVLSSLTMEEWKAAEAIGQHFESYRPQIAEKEKRVNGKEPKWIEPREFAVVTADGQRFTSKGWYYPVVFDPRLSLEASQHASAEDAKNQMKAAYNVATTRRSFVKERAEKVVGRPLLLSLQGMYSGINDVIHDLAWHEWVIDANKLLRSKSIDNAIREYYGPEVKREFEKWRDDIVAGTRRLDHAIEKAAGFFRQSVSFAGLAFNVVSALMQPFGLINSGVRVGHKWIGHGVARYASNPVQATRDAKAKSAFMENRTRTRFRELNELRNQIQGQTAVKELMGRYGYWMMMQTQQIVDVITWHAAYDKAIAEGLFKTTDEGTIDDRTAVNIADQAVKDAQGGGEELDQSGVERGGPMIKLFTTFYSFMATTLNVAYLEGKTEKSKAKAAVNMLLVLSVQPLLGSLLKDAVTPGGDDDDPEKIAKKLAAEQISFLLGTVAFGREFAQMGRVIMGEGKGMGYSGPPGLRAIADAYKLAGQARQGEFDVAFAKAFVNVLGDTVGIPSVQINRAITGAKALSEGNTKNPAALIMGYQNQ